MYAKRLFLGSPDGVGGSISIGPQPAQGGQGVPSSLRLGRPASNISRSVRIATELFPNSPTPGQKPPSLLGEAVRLVEKIGGYRGRNVEECFRS